MKKGVIDVGICLLVFLIILAMILAGCGNSAKKDNNESQEVKKDSTVIVLNMGASSTPEHSRYKAAEMFVKEVKEASNGTLEPRMHFGGVLGSETQMAQSVQAGTLEMGWISDIGLSTVVPEIGFVNLPYLFPSYEDVDKHYFNGWMGEIVEQRLEEKGFKFLAFLENDYRWLSNSKRPILKPEDIKGLKIRTVEKPMFINFFKALGALPTPMGINEVSTALQQGTIDGQDNGAILTYAYGFAQFQKYLTKTNHSYSGGAIVINKALWESLSPEQQKIIQDAATKAADWQIEKNRQDVSEYIEKMKELGMEISDITPELDTKFREIASQLWNDPENKKLYGEDVINRIKSEFSVK